MKRKTGMVVSIAAAALTASASFGARGRPLSAVSKV